jgi:hypothetical protein
MPEKSWFCIGIFTGSLLLQSGIGILASGPVWYHWSRISPALPSFDYTLLVCIFFSSFPFEPIPESLFSQYRWNFFHRVPSNFRKYWGETVQSVRLKTLGS